MKQAYNQGLIIGAVTVAIIAWGLSYFANQFAGVDIFHLIGL